MRAAWRREDSAVTSICRILGGHRNNNKGTGMAGRTALLLAAAAALGACEKPPAAPAVPRPVLVHRAAAAAAAPADYAGDIRARFETDLGFRIGGKIVARLVDVGATVRAGQVLARLDPADLALQAAQAEANRALAEAEARRYRDLTARQFVSQSALDTRETALKAAEAQAALARNQAAYATLTADHAGVITAVLAESGQVVAAGQPVLRLARPDEKEAVVGVPEGRVEEFRAAKALTVTPWALPNLHLAAHLRELSPLADPATRTYAARLSLVEHDPALQLGMTVRVSLPGAADPDAALVPSTAVVDQGQGAAVWVVADGRAQRLPVRVLQHREDGVLLSGIHAGQSVVVVGAHKLTAGEAVRPIIDEEAGGRR